MPDEEKYQSIGEFIDRAMDTADAALDKHYPQWRERALINRESLERRDEAIRKEERKHPFKRLLRWLDKKY